MITIGDKSLHKNSLEYRRKEENIKTQPQQKATKFKNVVSLVYNANVLEIWSISRRKIA